MPKRKCLTADQSLAMPGQLNLPGPEAVVVRVEGQHARVLLPALLQREPDAAERLVGVVEDFGAEYGLERFGVGSALEALDHLLIARVGHLMGGQERARQSRLRPPVGVPSTSKKKAGVLCM